jgi:hypothetical protein
VPILVLRVKLSPENLMLVLRLVADLFLTVAHAAPVVYIGFKAKECVTSVIEVLVAITSTELPEVKRVVVFPV